MVEKAGHAHNHSEAIYFDGYLPVEKRPVRMERSKKSTTQLSLFHSKHLQACPGSDISQGTGAPINPYENRRPPNKALLLPAFLVPAVIEALGKCPRYERLTRMVPGEADAYCAQHLSERGGLVLTSDSDLLAHDLGEGRVAFLRDVYMDSSERLACSTFFPRRLAESFGLAEGHLRRLGYECKCSPQSTLGQMQQACLKPVLDERDYQDFCLQYLQHETGALPVSIGRNTLSLDGLDPRISELVLQLGQSAPGRKGYAGDARFFLPHLLESPARGSAWEQSIPIRQLAYGIARWTIPGAGSSVLEYRRIQTIDQKGRQVDILSQDAVRVQTDNLLLTMAQLKVLTQNKKGMYWTLLCLVLDIQACEEQEKQSHALHTIKSPAPPKSPKVPWDIIHFVAQLQAAHYSLRILKQILALTHDDAQLLPETLTQLRDALSGLPPLVEYPDIDGTLQFLREIDAGVTQVLKEFVHIPSPRASKLSKIEKKKKKKKSTDVAKKGPGTLNMFDLLSEDR